MPIHFKFDATHVAASVSGIIALLAPLVLPHFTQAELALVYKWLCVVVTLLAGVTALIKQSIVVDPPAPPASGLGAESSLVLAAQIAPPAPPAVTPATPPPPALQRLRLPAFALSFAVAMGCASCTPAEITAIQSGDAILMNLVNAGCTIVNQVDASPVVTVLCAVLDAAGNVVATSTAQLPVAQAQLVVARHPASQALKAKIANGGAR